MKLSDKNIKILMSIYHLIFPILSWYLLIKNPHESDAERFIRIAENTNNIVDLFNLGSKAVSFLIYPFVKLGLDLLFFNLIFSLISLKGFLILYDLINDQIKSEKLIVRFIFLFWLFAPSLHYWTSFLGKEAIVFITIAVALKYIKTKKGKYTLISLGLISFLVRPYSLIILFTSYVISYVIENKYTIKSKQKYIITLIVFLIVVIPIFINNYLNIKNFNSISDLVSIFYQRVQEMHINRGSHFFDVYETSYLEKASILLFRPIFFDASNKLQYISSIQNLVNIIFLIFHIFLLIKIRKVKTNLSLNFALISSIVFWLTISTYIINLGQASRMRVMVIPLLFYSLNIINKKKIINILS